MERGRTRHLLGGVSSGRRGVLPDEGKREAKEIRELELVVAKAKANAQAEKLSEKKDFAQIAQIVEKDLGSRRNEKEHGLSFPFPKSRVKKDQTQTASSQ